jgi:hypothetical protein
MNKKETTASLAIVGVALLATITMISPTQALALGHWNLDEDFTPDMDFAEGGMDSSGASDNIDEEEEGPSDEEEEESTTAATTDEDEEEESADSDGNSGDREDSASSGYAALQDCLAELGESPTEEQAHECVELSYGEMESSENTATEDTDDGNDTDENDMTERVSTDDTEQVSADDTEVEEEEEEEEEEE